jgi:NAD(P)-dependent dehydrogenase (short-subunit alcohol dehydrogenase family)
VSAARVALVTGAASGIGAAIVRLLRAQGVTVAAADLAAIPAELDAALALRLDVADPQATIEAVERIEAELGRLDLAFLNAGLATPEPSGLEDLDLDTYRRVVGANLDGVVFGARAVLPALRRAGGGAIVATASLAGLTPIPGDPVYTLTKHAVVGLARSLGPAYAAQGITVAAVCPGFVRTPLLAPIEAHFTAAGFPLLGPEQVAAAALAAAAGEPGACWVVQPGREPAPYRFRGVPSAQSADGAAAVVPDAVVPAAPGASAPAPVVPGAEAR